MGVGHLCQPYEPVKLCTSDFTDPFHPYIHLKIKQTHRNKSTGDKTMPCSCFQDNS